MTRPKIALPGTMPSKNGSVLTAAPFQSNALAAR